MDESAFDGFRWIENDDEVDLASTLRLDDYHGFITDSAEPNECPHKRCPSFRRTLSLSSLPFGSSHQSTLTELAKTSSRESNILSAGTAAIRKRSVSGRRLSFRRSHRPSSSVGTTNTITALEPSAIHYTDPGARLKLRVYLASPQKFDEAIEFGFPSMDDPCCTNEKETLGHRSRSSVKRISSMTPGRTCLYDDTFSDVSSTASFLMDGSEATSDTKSLPERSLPYTPLDAAFPDTYLLSPSEAPSSLDHHHGAALSLNDDAGVTDLIDAKHTSLNPTITDLSVPSTTTISSLFPPPKIRHNYDAGDPFIHALSGAGREMTLHMTLTRPDLRGDVSEAGAKAPFVVRKTSASASATTQGREASADPLALERLTLAGDNIWESLPPPKEDGKWKRVWRKVSGKGF